MKDLLSSTALHLLRELVNDHRRGVQRGSISYGDDAAQADALSDLDELDRLAEQIEDGTVGE